MNYWERQLRLTPNGSQTLSKMPCRYPEVYPKLLESGRGMNVYDIEGHKYIDLISGLGAISVGYANEEINEAIYKQLKKGVLFSLSNKLEADFSEKLCEVVPGTEMWKFGKNGTDGTVMAVRAARAYTKRTKIMTVGYNGCADVFECQGVRNAGIPEVLKEQNTRAVYNELSSFSDILLGGYACVLLEPMVYDSPKSGFLETLRDACNASGTLLIFDEVVNGGRFETFTSSHYFKVCPDYYVLGKGLSNGSPLCAVGGTRRFMSVFERDDFFASGTFGGECLSLAAGIKTVSILQQALPRMVIKGKRIQEAFNKLPWPERCEAKGYPTRLNFLFPTPAHKYLFWQEMCLNGVLLGYANFVKADMTDSECTAVIEAVYKAYHVVKDNWTHPKNKILGKFPEEALKNRSN